MENTDNNNLLTGEPVSVKVNVVKPQKSSKFKTFSKAFTVACLIGAIAYVGNDQMQPEQSENLLEEEVRVYIEVDAGEIKPWGNKDLQREYMEETPLPTLGVSVPIGCSVNIDRLLNQDTVITEWNNNANSRTPYEDESFLAQKDYTLYWENYLDNAQIQMYNEGYKDVSVWQRPHEFDKTRVPSLWGDKGILPHGIVQGGLGSCYFLAAAASLAVVPSRIEKIYQNSQYTASGIFMVTLYHRGEPVKVIVDDRLPLYPNPSGRYVNQIFNAKMSPNNAWWGPILEKAYCKMNINCGNINGGTPLQSFRDLTGMPTEKYEIKDLTDAQFFDVVVSSRGKAWPMVASCMVPNYGLQDAHAYALMAGEDLGGNQLIKVMNPWGKEEYTGPWNDNDTRWTPEFKRQVNLEIADDGIFYMPISVFRSSFETFQVNMYDDNWKVDRFRLKAGTVAQSVTFDVESSHTQEAVVTLDYQNKRQYPPGCTRPFVDKVNLNLFVKQGNTTVGQEGIFGDIGYGYFRWPDGIKAGIKYTIEIYDFAGRNAQDFTVTMYASTKKVTLDNAHV